MLGTTGEKDEEYKRIRTAGNVYLRNHLLVEDNDFRWASLDYYRLVYPLVRQGQHEMNRLVQVV